MTHGLLILIIMYLVSNQFISTHTPVINTVGCFTFIIFIKKNKVILDQADKIGSKSITYSGCTEKKITKLVTQ